MFLHKKKINIMWLYKMDSCLWGVRVHGNMQSSFRRMVIKEGWSIVWVSTAIASSYYTSVTSNEKNQPKKKKRKKETNCLFVKQWGKCWSARYYLTRKWNPKKSLDDKNCKQKQKPIPTLHQNKKKCVNVCWSPQMLLFWPQMSFSDLVPTVLALPAHT